MSFYEDLGNRDWVQYFEEQFDSMQVRFDKDGKFKVFERLVHNSPWVHTPASAHQEIHNKCGRYQEIFAGKIGCIHSTCLDCYKVVVKPKTVKQLFELCDYQWDINLPSKCGIERRPFVPRLYGGYFYNRGLEMGRECHALVEKGVHSLISKDIEVILKRGCTEFEIKYGPSDKWKMLPEQEFYEARFDELFVEDAATPDKVPDYIIAHTKRLWLHWAADAKPPDYTYKEFTDGKSLARECNYITYHDKPDIKVVGK